MAQRRPRAPRSNSRYGGSHWSAFNIGKRCEQAGRTALQASPHSSIASHLRFKSFYPRRLDSWLVRASPAVVQSSVGRSGMRNRSLHLKSSVRAILFLDPSFTIGKGALSATKCAHFHNRIEVLAACRPWYQRSEFLAKVAVTFA